MWVPRFRPAVDASAVAGVRAVELAKLFDGGFLMRFIFLLLAMLMVFVWIGAFVMYHVASFFVHAFLILAVVFFVIHLVSGRRST
jgi:hypothetical protein